MFDLVRRSPILFHQPSTRTEPRDGWEVVLEYQNEGPGPWLMDLSHCSKWDVQDSDLDTIHPWDLTIPELPNQSCLVDGRLINRMNRTQASIWCLKGTPAASPQGTMYTQTTDGVTLLALAGPSVMAFLEKITPLDMGDPQRVAPYLVQGPVMHIPCQTVVLNKTSAPLVLIAFSRGYGQNMAEALLDTGRNIGLHPAGEARFHQCLEAAC